MHPQSRRPLALVTGPIVINAGTGSAVKSTRLEKVTVIPLMRGRTATQPFERAGCGGTALARQQTRARRSVRPLTVRRVDLMQFRVPLLANGRMSGSRCSVDTRTRGTFAECHIIRTWCIPAHGHQN